MIGIKPVSVPGSFATRLDPRSVSPHGGATLAGKLPAPRGELIQERGPETALSARRVTAGGGSDDEGGLAGTDAAEGSIILGGVGPRGSVCNAGAPGSRRHHQRP